MCDLMEFTLHLSVSKKKYNYGVLSKCMRCAKKLQEGI